jgi:MFS family permease
MHGVASSAGSPGPSTPPESVPPARPLVLAPGDAARRVRDTLWISAVEGSFTTVFFNWTSGAVLTGYMLHLGAGPHALAAVASVPLLAQMLNPFLAWWASQVRHRIAFIMTVTSLGRGVWLVAALLPLLGLPAHLLPLALVAVVALSSLLQTGAGPPWVALMADVVPAEVRGRYFGLRNGAVGVVGMLATVGAGLYLDRAPAPAGFQMVLVAAVMFAAVGVHLYGLHYDPHPPPVRLSLWDALRTPWRDANFRRFVAFSMYWNAAVMLAAPFVIPYFFTHLRMTFTQVALWSAIASLCALFTAPLWGRVADQTGHKAVLTITTFLVGAVLPLCWMLARPGHLFFIWVSGVMDALAWGGVNTAMFNLTLASAPARHRMSYLAMLGLATGAAGCAAGLLSGPLLEQALRVEGDVFGYRWTGYHWIFLLAGLLRTQAWRLLRNVHESRAWPAQEVLRELWSRAVNRLPWRQL